MKKSQGSRPQNSNRIVSLLSAPFSKSTRSSQPCYLMCLEGIVTFLGHIPADIINRHNLLKTRT